MTSRNPRLRRLLARPDGLTLLELLISLTLLALALGGIYRFVATGSLSARQTNSFLQVQAVLMAGNVGDGVNSSVNVQNYNSGPPRGIVTLLGGIIEEYYGAFGTFDPATGNPLTGYGRAFTYDRRMGRGFAPPYFPTTNLFEVVEGDGLAGNRPVWREASP